MSRTALGSFAFIGTLICSRTCPHEYCKIARRAWLSSPGGQFLREPSCIHPLLSTPLIEGILPPFRNGPWTDAPADDPFGFETADLVGSPLTFGSYCPRWRTLSTGRDQQGRPVSLLIFSQDQESVTILTDTLAATTNGEPLIFQTKA